MHLFPGEEHPPEEAPDELLVLVLGVLAEPLYEVQPVGRVEVLGVLVGQVLVGDGLAPFDLAGVRFGFAGQDFVEGRQGGGLVAQQGDLVVAVHRETHVAEQDRPVGAAFLQSGYFQDLIPHLPLGLEGDKGVAAGRGLDLLDVEFLKGLFAASRLLGF